MLLHYHHTLLLLVSFAILGCKRVPPSVLSGPANESKAAEDCRCPYLRQGYEHLRPGTKIKVESTNASITAIREWKDFEVELDLDLNKPLQGGNLSLATLKGKAVIPYFDDGTIKYYRLIEVDNSAFSRFQQYMLQSCALYERYYVDNNCAPSEEQLKAYEQEEHALQAHLLGIQYGKKSTIYQERNTAKPRLASQPTTYEVTVMYPRGVKSPQIRVEPAAVRINSGAYRAILEVVPGNYQLTLQQDDAVWYAHFSQEHTLIAPYQFTKQPF